MSDNDAGAKTGTIERIPSEDSLGMADVISGETSAHALAAQVTATVQARYIMAMKRPRDWEKVENSLLAHCKRPSFAAKAMWEKDVGRGKIKEDLNIRFAEVAMQCMGNLLPQAFVVFDDGEKRIVRIALTDLESNLTYEKDVVVAKKTERTKVWPNTEVLETYQNSQGNTVYICKATENDVYKQENSFGSKMLRNHALRLLPVDIQDKARELIRQTLVKTKGKNLEQSRKDAIAAFEDLGIKSEQLEDLLGHPIIDLTAAEAARLQVIYTSIRDGESDFETVLNGAKVKRGEKAATGKKEPKTGSVSMEDLSAGDAATHQDHDESAAAMAAATKKAPAKKEAKKRKSSAKKAAEKKDAPPPAKKDAAPEKTTEEKLTEVMKIHEVPADQMGPVLEKVFKSPSNAMKDDAPGMLDAWLADNWPPQPEGETPPEEEGFGMGETAENPVNEDGSEGSNKDVIPEDPTEPFPELPEGTNWAHGIRAAFSEAQVDGKDLPFDQRKQLITSVCGTEVLTSKGGLDTRKIEFKHYYWLRRHLAMNGWLEGTQVLETEDGVELPGVDYADESESAEDGGEDGMGF